MSVILGHSSGSSALFLFGADSIVEVASSFLVLWRLLDGRMSLERERFAVVSIGALIAGLGIASYCISVYLLVMRSKPETALPSLVVGALSSVVMLTAWRVKLALATRLGSSTLASDAFCSLSCACASGVVLISGVVFQITSRIWWIDAAATLLLAHFFFTEGRAMVTHGLSKDFTGGCGCCGESKPAEGVCADSTYCALPDDCRSPAESKCCATTCGTDADMRGGAASACGQSSVSCSEP